MTKLFIPPLGTKIKLTKDWYFNLHICEHRNTKLAKDLNLKPKNLVDWREYMNQAKGIIMPAGTVLSVDRIYIKQGQESFDSVSFKILESPHPLLKSVKGKNKGRFWAKLSDVNEIECEIVND